MNTRSFTFNLSVIALILALLPFILLVSAPMVFKDHFNEILTGVSSLISVLMVAQWLGMSDYFFRHSKNILIGKPKKTNSGLFKTEYRTTIMWVNTVPSIIVVCVLTVISILFIDQSFFNEHFKTLLISIGSLVGGMLLYALLGGECEIVSKETRKHEEFDINP